MAVLIVWAGLAINIADGTAGWIDFAGAVMIPVTQYGAFWSPASGLLRNAERW